jgi:hypothetical protein
MIRLCAGCPLTLLPPQRVSWVQISKALPQQANASFRKLYKVPFDVLHLHTVSPVASTARIRFAPSLCTPACPS